MQDKYEIHFVKNGCKQVILVDSHNMSTVEAWRSALLHDGACIGTLIHIHDHDTAINAAHDRGVNNVRWNKATHTFSWIDREKVDRSTLRIKKLD